MNHYRLNFLVLIFIASSPGLIAAESGSVGASLTVSLSEAEQAMLRHNPQLRSKDYDIQASSAQLSQDKRYDNPNISSMYNVYNPSNKRYFDTSRDGEIDLQIEQSIAIGGQHKEKVRESQAMTESSKYNRKDTERQLLQQLDEKFIELYYLQKENHIYEKENLSLEKIHQAYQEQMEKGNIPELEVQRIENMHFQLLQEQQELLTSEKDLEKDIRLLTGLPEDKDIIPVINDRQIISSLSSVLNLKELLAMAQSRPDIIAQNYNIQASEHEVKLQKAKALPQVSLQGEYDKNGNIGHNYFGVGVGLSIPIFDHNKGNIKVAEIQSRQAQLDQETNRQQIEADIRQNFNQLFLDKKIVDEADGKFSNSIDDLINQAELQYMKRNISMLEFLDLYTSYKDSYIAINESKKRLLDSAVNMNALVGSNIIKLND